MTDFNKDIISAVEKQLTGAQAGVIKDIIARGEQLATGLDSAEKTITSLTVERDSARKENLELSEAKSLVEQREYQVGLAEGKVLEREASVSEREMTADMTLMKKELECLKDARGNEKALLNTLFQNTSIRRTVTRNHEEIEPPPTKDQYGNPQYGTTRMLSGTETTTENQE